MSEPQNGRGAPFVGGLAAILAQTRCFESLVLVAQGSSGAWIGNQIVLESYRPIFRCAALIALFFVRLRIFRPLAACKPGEVRAVPQVRTAYKLIFWTVAALLLVGLVFPYAFPVFRRCSGMDRDTNCHADRALHDRWHLLQHELHAVQDFYPFDSGMPPTSPAIVRKRLLGQQQACNTIPERLVVIVRLHMKGSVHETGKIVL